VRSWKSLTRKKKVNNMWGFLMFATFVVGSIQLINEYKYVLEFKKEERLFNEYKKKSVDELNDIITDPDADKF
jgi:hypothetical protein